MPVLAVGIGCNEETSLGPPPSNMTGAVTSSTGRGEDTVGTDESDTAGTDGADLPSCDPFADPVEECGADQECDPSTLTCVGAVGTGLVDESCSGEGDCAPGLACDDGRCRALCDLDALDLEPGDPGTCDDGRTCASAVEAGGDLPGVCLETCSLVDQDCSLPGDGCNRVAGAGFAVAAACTSNPGFALVGEACTTDGDCTPGFLCTPESVHSLGCDNAASDCCATICDLTLLPCFGLESICYTLGIADQPESGFCGI